MTGQARFDSVLIVNLTSVLYCTKVHILSISAYRPAENKNVLISFRNVSDHHVSDGVSITIGLFLTAYE